MAAGRPKDLMINDWKAFPLQPSRTTSIANSREDINIEDVRVLNLRMMNPIFGREGDSTTGICLHSILSSSGLCTSQRAIPPRIKIKCSANAANASRVGAFQSR